MSEEVGLNVSGLFRDYLVAHGMDYDQALNISLEVDLQIREADWLSTYNGTTFEKTFEPGE